MPPVEPFAHGPKILEVRAALAPLSNVKRSRRVYVNRNLRMEEIELIGFDMDYTLAIYNQPRMERLSIEATLKKLVEKWGYDPAIQTLEYDPAFAIRGLVIDRRYGNILKVDRYGHVGRTYHGRRPLSREERKALYQTVRIHSAQSRYACIDTLFSLPEATMYATLVDFLEERGKPNYNQLWQDIRDAIDEAHRDDTLKPIIVADLPSYIERDPDLALTLHKFRSAGKRLFLLTNSLWSYTDAVMSYLLEGVLEAYPSWRSFFDIIVVGSRKPDFFTSKEPFLELDEDGAPRGPASSLQRGRIYQGGNIHDFERLAGSSGDRVLYIGDHIFGDMLRSKKSTTWRTAMIIQELEQEIALLERLAPKMARLEAVERRIPVLEADVAQQHALLRSLQRLGEGKQLEEERRAARSLLEDLRAQLRETTEEQATLEAELQAAFNPYWGAIFREGAENSRFGEQVEDYACVYTSRVSNFLAYPPNHYFRSPRDHMPHEIL